MSDSGPPPLRRQEGPRTASDQIGVSLPLRRSPPQTVGLGVEVAVRTIADRARQKPSISKPLEQILSGAPVRRQALVLATKEVRGIARQGCDEDLPLNTVVDEFSG